MVPDVELLLGPALKLELKLVLKLELKQVLRLELLVLKPMLMFQTVIKIAVNLLK